jgi:hypothetical protein
VSYFVLCLTGEMKTRIYTLLTHNRMDSLEKIYILVHLNCQDSVLQVNYLEHILYTVTPSLITEILLVP